MSEFKTSEGMVEVDVSRYENLSGIFVGADIVRAKPVGCAMPVERNGGGHFDFSVQSFGAFLELMESSDAIVSA